MGDRIAYYLMARQVKETETQSSRDHSVVTVVLRVEQIDRTEAQTVFWAVPYQISIIDIVRGVEERGVRPE